MSARLVDLFKINTEDYSLNALMKSAQNAYRDCLNEKGESLESSYWEIYYQVSNWMQVDEFDENKVICLKASEAFIIFEGLQGIKGTSNLTYRIGETFKSNLFPTESYVFVAVQINLFESILVFLNEE